MVNLCLANMTPYIYSYVRARVDPNADKKLTIWLSAIALVMQGVMMPIGGLVSQKIGFRPVVGISCVVHSGSVLLTYVTVLRSYTGVILTYALVQGAGFGFGYSVIFGVATGWFPTRRPLIFGLVVGGFGLGALIFTPIQMSFINPDNIPTVNGSSAVYPMSPCIQCLSHGCEHLMCEVSVLPMSHQRTLDSPEFLCLNSNLLDHVELRANSESQIVQMEVYLQMRYYKYNSKIIKLYKPEINCLLLTDPKVHTDSKPRVYKIAKQHIDLNNTSDDKVKERFMFRRFVDDSVLNRLPKCFLLCGGVLLGIQIIGFCLMQQRPSKVRSTLMHDIKPGEEEEIRVEEEEIENISTSYGLFCYLRPFQSPLSHPHIRQVSSCDNTSFLIALSTKCIFTSRQTLYLSRLQLFGQAYITDDRFLSAVATVSSAFNSGGRIFWGLVVDKFSFKLPLCILLSIWAVVLVTFPHLYLAGGTALRILYVIWVCLLWFSLSGVLTIIPSATAILFGQKNVATNYGVVYSAFSFGSLLCGIFQTFLPEQPYVVQFSTCFVLVTG
ncbi:hypothetical protein T265_14167, partial [Opisthorchis viverrini]